MLALLKLWQRKKFNLDDLLKKVISLLPEGQPFYPTDVKTDKDEVFPNKKKLFVKRF